MEHFNALLDWVGQNAWGLTLLSFHILFTWGVASLFCTAPDALQKIALAFMLAALLMLVVFYASSLVVPPTQSVADLAYKIQHVAVLIGIARLLWLEKLSCRNYSTPCPSSVA
jgi:hypothetical protein